MEVKKGWPERCDGVSQRGDKGWGTDTPRLSDPLAGVHRTWGCRRWRRCSAGQGLVPAHGSSRHWKNWWLGAGESRAKAWMLLISEPVWVGWWRLTVADQGSACAWCFAGE